MVIFLVDLQKLYSTWFFTLNMSDMVSQILDDYNKSRGRNGIDSRFYLLHHRTAVRHTEVSNFLILRCVASCFQPFL